MEKFYTHFLSENRGEKQGRWKKVRKRIQVRNKQTSDDECGKCFDNAPQLERVEDFMGKMRKAVLSIEHFTLE